MPYPPPPHSINKTNTTTVRSKLVTALTSFLQSISLVDLNFDMTLQLTGHLCLTVDSGQCVQFTVDEHISRQARDSEDSEAGGCVIGGSKTGIVDTLSARNGNVQTGGGKDAHFDSVSVVENPIQDLGSKKPLAEDVEMDISTWDYDDLQDVKMDAANSLEKPITGSIDNISIDGGNPLVDNDGLKVTFRPQSGISERPKVNRTSETSQVGVAETVVEKQESSSQAATPSQSGQRGALFCQLDCSLIIC